MEKKVISIISNILGVETEKISLDSDLNELGMNSLQFVKLVVELEIEFDMEFDDDDLVSTKLNTASKMINAISKR